MNVLPACDHSACYMQKARRLALPQVNVLLEMLPTLTTEAGEEMEDESKSNTVKIK